MINTTYITMEHLLWAAQNKVVISDGECGFGRKCVGVLGLDDSWVEYNDGYYGRGATLNPEELPTNAYHKHPCIAVLVHDDEEFAWRELSEWLDLLIAKGYAVEYEENKYDEGTSVIEMLLHGTTQSVLVAPEKTNDSMGV
jgi:hypothetical protein